MANFKKRKKPNNKRAIVLIIVLIVVVFLWFNVEGIISSLFGVKD